MELYLKKIEKHFVNLTVICTNDSIIRLSFENDNYSDWIKRCFGDYVLCGENALCRQCEGEIDSYFEGKLREFTVPVELLGATAFEQNIWNALRRIPYGKTVNYAQLANMAGVRGARAAGNALAKNPVAIILPCHRVIKADGSLGGFCGGTDMTYIKRELLSLESKVIQGD